MEFCVFICDTTKNIFKLFFRYFTIFITPFRFYELKYQGEIIIHVNRYYPLYDAMYKMLIKKKDYRTYIL